MKINPKNVSNVETLNDLIRYSSIAINDLTRVVNGNVGFKDNCQVDIISVPIKTANTDTVVKHALGRTADGYILVGNTNGVVVIDGKGSSTDQYILIQGDRVGTVKVMVF